MISCSLTGLPHPGAPIMTQRRSPDIPPVLCCAASMARLGGKHVCCFLTFSALMLRSWTILQLCDLGHDGFVLQKELGQQIIPRTAYHIRVLVPCYSEPTAVITNTVARAANATTPQGGRRLQDSVKSKLLCHACGSELHTEAGQLFASR